MRPSVQHVLDALTGAAAFVHNTRLDNLAANQLGYALYSDMFSRAAGAGPVNSPATSSSTPALASSTSTGIAPPATSSPCCAQRPAATPTTATSQSSSSRLSTRSAEFRTRWAAHNLRFHDTGIKELHHPVVGDLTSPTTAWTSPPTPGRCSRSGPPNPEPSPRRRSASSEAGPRRLNSQSYKTPQTIPKPAQLGTLGSGSSNALANGQRVVNVHALSSTRLALRQYDLWLNGAAQESNLPSRGLHDLTGLEDFRQNRLFAEKTLHAGCAPACAPVL